MFGRRTSSETVLDQKQPARENLRGGEDVQPLWEPTQTKARKSVEALLLERGHVTDEQLVQAKNVQAQTPGKNVTQILLTMNAASEAQILAAVAEVNGLTFETPERA